MDLDKYLESKLDSLKEKNEYRSLVIPEGFLDFSSNDYLGLAKESLPHFKVSSGSTGSRLITGNSKLFEDLEQKIADWKGTEAALFFGSGYLANLGTISALVGPRDVIFSDELNHSCILDGIRLSGAKKFFYRHLDTEHLQELLEKHRADYDNAFVITDSIFSMQGACCDLPGIIALKEKYDFAFYLDEAHATGTKASNGAGLYADLVEEGKVKPGQVEIQMGTFSKACGVEGGYVAGSKTLIDFLINKARTFIYSTAPSPLIVSAVSHNLDKLIAASDKRVQLQNNISYFAKKLKELDLDFTNDETAIFAINLNSNEQALKLSKEFEDEKIFVKAIRPPTTPKPCLRICLHADHNQAQMDQVLTMLYHRLFQCSAQ